MTKKQMSKILNEGDAIKWNKYRKVHSKWVPDLRGINLNEDDSHFNRGLAQSFWPENFNMNGAIYDLTTDFPLDVKPDDYGMILKRAKKKL